MIVNLHPNVSSLARLASKEEQRFAMCGILVKAEGGNYRAEATNGRVLGIVQGPNDGPWAHEQYADNPARKQAIVPTEELKNAFGGKSKSVVHLITEGAEHNLVLVNGSKVILAQECQGKWPQTQQVMPRRSPSFAVSVDPLLLAELLRVAGGVMDDESRRVTLAFYPNKDYTGGLLGVVARNNTTGQVFDGILVPLADEPTNVRIAKPHETNGKAKGH